MKYECRTVQVGVTGHVLCSALPRLEERGQGSSAGRDATSRRESEPGRVATLRRLRDAHLDSPPSMGIFSAPFFEM